MTEKQRLQAELDELRLITTDADCIDYAKTNWAEYRRLAELEARLAVM